MPTLHDADRIELRCDTPLPLDQETGTAGDEDRLRLSYPRDWRD